jgi:hypothetical protein
MFTSLHGRFGIGDQLPGLVTGATITDTFDNVPGHGGPGGIDCNIAPVQYATTAGPHMSINVFVFDCCWECNSDTSNPCIAPVCPICSGILVPFDFPDLTALSYSDVSLAAQPSILCPYVQFDITPAIADLNDPQGILLIFS